MKNKGKKENKNSKAFQLSFSAAAAVIFLPEEEEATTRVVVVGAVQLKEKEIHRYFQFFFCIFYAQQKARNSELELIFLSQHTSLLVSSRPRQNRPQKRGGTRIKERKKENSKKDDERGRGRDRHVSVSVSREGGIRRRKRTERDG